MSNSYFQFKQFRISQEKAAMKVCTDSCIFGAWINPGKAKEILDIGTGTGLLSLMLAQKSSARIDAVEMEPDAYEEAKNNFNKSKWKDRLNLYHQRIQDYAQSQERKYDLIMSNPPFFKGQLKSPDIKRNIALHSEFLTVNELLSSIRKLLKENGKLFILLPPEEFLEFTQAVSNIDLFLNKRIIIQDKINLPVFRIAGCFSYKEVPIKEEALIIKKPDGSYTDNFISMLKDYYFYL